MKHTLQHTAFAVAFTISGSFAMSPFSASSALQSHGSFPQFVSKASYGVQKIKLDSIVTPKKSKSFYEYDNRGNQVANIFYSWDVGSASWKRAYDSPSTWEDDSWKTTYIYDDKTHSQTEILCKWDSLLSTFSLNSTKEEKTFDESGGMTSWTTYDWSNSVSNWIPQYKYIYALNSSSQILSVTASSWSTGVGQFTPWLKTDLVYNSNGHLISEIKQNWNSQVGAWISSTKVEYVRDVNGNKITETDYAWNKSFGLWAKESKTECSYDSYNNRLTNNYYNWDTITGVFKLNTSSFRKYTYDAKGNVISGVDSSKGISTYSMTYDLSTDFRNIIYPPYILGNYFPSDGSPKVVNTLISMNDGTETDNWFYSNASLVPITTPQTISSSALSVSCINIKNTSLNILNRTGTPIICEIFTANGRILKTANIKAPVGNIPISDLPVGFYLVQFKCGQSMIGTKRFIKN